MTTEKLEVHVNELVDHMILESRRYAFNDPNLLVILVARKHDVDRYVTWVFNEKTNERAWGHYFDDLSNALNDFKTR